MQNQRLAIIGPYPEPYGGVSLHIKRLKEHLQTEYVHCTVYDTNRIPKKSPGVIPITNPRDWFLKLFLLSKRKGILHFHSTEFGYKEMVKFSLMLLSRSKLLITFHNFRYDTSKLNKYQRLIVKIILRKIHCFVAVNHIIKQKLVNLGVKSQKVYVIPAFLPPKTKPEELKKIPIEIWDFMRKHHPIISANAYRIVFYNNEDLYGIDLCINMCRNLKNNFPNIGFIFALPDIGDYAYFHNVQELIKKKGIADNFLFITSSYQFYPILIKSNLFVRPTNTDGDAVSIREALHFGIPVVASDAVPRPEGTILFKNRDINDLTFKVTSTLGNYKNYKHTARMAYYQNFFPQILQIYEALGLKTI